MASPLLLLLVLPLLYGRGRAIPPRFAVEYQTDASGDRWLFDGMHPDSTRAAKAIAAWEAQGDRIGPHAITAKRIRQIEPVLAWTIFAVGAAGAPPGPHVLAVFPTYDAASATLQRVKASGLRSEWGHLSMAKAWTPSDAFQGAPYE